MKAFVAHIKGCMVSKHLSRNDRRPTRYINNPASCAQSHSVGLGSARTSPMKETIWGEYNNSQSLTPHTYHMQEHTRCNGARHLSKTLSHLRHSKMNHRLPLSCGVLIPPEQYNAHDRIDGCLC